MAMVRYKPDPGAPPALSAATIARLDAMTPEDIERNAETDPDNPPLTAEELESLKIARGVQAVRNAIGLSQAAFAETYCIPLARVRDWEQGRVRPDATARAYLTAIRYEPKTVASAMRRSA